MSDFDPNAPVIVGVGEASGRSLGAEWPSPTTLAEAAINAALNDSGAVEALGAATDCLAALRTFEDSGVPIGVGSPDNVPDAYANAAGLSPEKLIYADVGGQSPQAMVNELAGQIQRGEIGAAVVAGAEAMGTAKRARKAGHKLDWSAASDRDYDNRLSDFPILSRTEIRHGIISMPLAYSLIENARRIGKGQDSEAYLQELTQLWSAFSQKSLSREHAQFAKDWSAEALASDADGNYQLTSAYKRWMVAQDGVDLAGAVILTSAGKARELGISDDRMIWLCGAGEGKEPTYSERANLSGSDAQIFAVNAALDQAGLQASDLGPIDIYSCFPCAVFAAVDTMGLPDRPLGDYTLTGGLTFFGGPGNCYSLHSIAAMVQALRSDGAKPAMITANGGVMSKQAVGIYSAQPPQSAWTGETVRGYEAKPAVLNDAPSGAGKVLTYVQGITKDGAGPATLLTEMEDGRRALAMMSDVADANLDNALVTLEAGEKRHAATLA